MIRDTLRQVLLRRTSSAEPSLATELAEHIALDPRSHRAIYDRASGFLASWYMQLRAEEECARSFRHHRPLAVVLIEPAQNDVPVLRAWLHANLRSTDLVCRRHDDCYLVLLPETDQVGASTVLGRLLSDVALVRFTALEVSGDFDLFRELIRSLDTPWGRAA